MKTAGQLNGQESASQCRRRRFNPGMWKISWRRKWQPTPVLLPGKSHGQRSLTSYSSWGHKQLDMTEQLSTPRWVGVGAVTLAWMLRVRDTCEEEGIAYDEGSRQKGQQMQRPWGRACLASSRGSKKVSVAKAWPTAKRSGKEKGFSMNNG